MCNSQFHIVKPNTKISCFNATNVITQHKDFWLSKNRLLNVMCQLYHGRNSYWCIMKYIVVANTCVSLYRFYFQICNFITDSTEELNIKVHLLPKINLWVIPLTASISFSPTMNHSIIHFLTSLISFIMCHSSCHSLLVIFPSLFCKKMMIVATKE